MSELMLMKAPEAMVEAALRAGCQLFCAYPITPVEDMAAYWTERRHAFPGALPARTDSEIEAGAFLLGFSAAGKRCAFASTGIGTSLLSEALGNLVASERPCVIIHFGRHLGLVMSQADYFQVVKGPSEGDNRLLVLAPMGTQESVDLVTEAFDLADRYRTPVVILSDTSLGLTMEAVEFSTVSQKSLPAKDWAVTGDRRQPNSNSRFMAAEAAEAESRFAGLSVTETAVRLLHEKYLSFPVKAELTDMEDAEVAVVAYGTMARVVLYAQQKLRAEGMRVGMIRPITLYPFPSADIARAAERVRKIGVLELSTGQMVEDVRLAANGRCEVELYARPGGAVPTPAEIEQELLRLLAGTEVKV